MKIPAETVRKYYKVVEVPDDTVIFESATTGNYDVELTAGKYEVYVIGGGAQAIFNCGHAGSGGGSGSGFIGVVQMPAGTYTCHVARVYGAHEGCYNAPAGENSYIGDAVITYGGAAHSSAQVSAGGAVPTVNVPIISETLNVAGNAGQATGSAYGAAGGASVWGGYGAGGGGRAASTVGYIKIIQMTKEEIVPATEDDYDFYKDELVYKAVYNDNKLYGFYGR